MRSLIIAVALVVIAVGCGSSAAPESMPREDVAPVSTSVVLVTTTARPGPGSPSPWMATNTTRPASESIEDPITTDTTDTTDTTNTSSETGEPGEVTEPEDYCTIAKRAYDEIEAFTAFEDPAALEGYMRGYLATMDQAAEVIPLHLSFDYDLVRDEVRNLIVELEDDGWQINSAFALFDTTSAELANAYDAIENYERETCGF